MIYAVVTVQLTGPYKPNADHNGVVGSASFTCQKTPPPNDYVAQVIRVEAETGEALKDKLHKYITDQSQYWFPPNPSA
jgi:hypothetical protein